MAPARRVGRPGETRSARGYPPDIVGAATTLWRLHYENYWELTACQWQKRLDPTYDTYGTDLTGLATYNYISRLSVSDVGAELDSFATTGLRRRAPGDGAVR